MQLPECMLSHSDMSDSAIPWTVACQAPLSIEFSKQEYWNGLPCPSPRDLPELVIKPRSLTLQADSLPSEPQGSPPKDSCFRTQDIKNTSMVFQLNI